MRGIMSVYIVGFCGVLLCQLVAGCLALEVLHAQLVNIRWNDLAWCGASLRYVPDCTAITWGEGGTRWQQLYTSFYFLLWSGSAISFFSREWYALVWTSWQLSLYESNLPACRIDVQADASFCGTLFFCYSIETQLADLRTRETGCE